MRKISFIVLGLVVMGLFEGFASADDVATSQPAVPDVIITAPLDYQIVQRAAGGSGTLLITGHLSSTSSATAVEARAIVPTRSIEIPFRALDLKGDKTFSGRLTVPSGGWYWLEVRARSLDKSMESTVGHVGVGEVFVVGGQSNSTNYGEVKTKTLTGMVTVFDGKGWMVAADPLPGVDGKGGSPWCAFGDDLVNKLHVPVGIVPVGRGSTSVRQWLPKGDVVAIEPSRDYGLKKLADGTWESEGQLFDRMVERMKALGPNGFRAMLWHQGESDAHQTGGHTLPGVQYRAMLERVIKESRKEAGWEVPWFVATASWGSPQTPADPDIRAAQEGVVADGVALAGPDTDTLLGENRQKNGTGVHMSAVGLKAHGELWAGIVGKWVEEKLDVHPAEVQKAESGDGK
jgi:hypothetical protein